MTRRFAPARGADQWRAARDLEDVPPFLDRRGEYGLCSEDDVSFIEGGGSIDLPDPQPWPANPIAL